MMGRSRHGLTAERILAQKSRRDIVERYWPIVGGVGQVVWPRVVEDMRNVCARRDADVTIGVVIGEPALHPRRGQTDIRRQFALVPKRDFVHFRVLEVGAMELAGA